MKKIFSVITTILVFLLLSFSAQAKRVMEIDDALKLVSVGGNFHLSPDGFQETTLMSPDGEEVFFSKSKVDWDNNRRVSSYYLVSSNGGPPREVKISGNASAFQYSPKGTYISYLHQEGEHLQLFVMPSKGGKARQITSLNSSVFAYRWSQDESQFFFLADDPLSPEEQRAYELGADWFYVDEAPNGRIAARWRNLWAVDLKGKNARQITKEDLIIDELDVSPDAKHIAFVARPDNRRNYPHTAELYTVETSGKNLTRLTDNLAPESYPLWSPDGTSIAYYAPDDENYRLTKGYLWVKKFPSGKTKQLMSQNMGDIYSLTWSNDSKSLLFSEQQRMNTNLFQLNIETDKLIALTNVEGSLKALSFSADRNKMVYSYTDFNTPLDLYASSLDNSDSVRLTNANPWVKEDVALANFEVVRWQSKDGLEIEGMLSVPAGYKKGQRVPLLVLVHGGPPQQWANEFYYEAQIYSGLGYAILGANVRGSSGYGEELLRALIGDIGGGEYEDIMSGVDTVINMGIADPDRLAIRGWSWGGVLSSWAITQTDRFKAASVGAGVMSWLSEMGPGFNWDLTEWYMGKSHWDDPKSWREVSSLTYVKNVTTPTLIIHGDDDWYSSYNQSLIFFTGLRDIGKAPVRFISYPGRGHEEFDPWGQRFRYVEEIKWMQKYVNGIDWKPKERK